MHAVALRGEEGGRVDPSVGGFKVGAQRGEARALLETVERECIGDHLYEA